MKDIPHAFSQMLGLRFASCDTAEILDSSALPSSAPPTLAAPKYKIIKHRLDNSDLIKFVLPASELAHKPQPADSSASTPSSPTAKDVPGPPLQLSEVQGGLHPVHHQQAKGEPITSPDSGIM